MFFIAINTWYRVLLSSDLIYQLYISPNLHNRRVGLNIQIKGLTLDALVIQNFHHLLVYVEHILQMFTETVIGSCVQVEI